MIQSKIVMTKVYQVPRKGNVLAAPSRVPRTSNLIVKMQGQLLKAN